VQAVGQGHRTVDEPVHLVDGEPAVTQRSTQDPATLGAQVDS
jgi:hypothetical protein